MELLKKQNIYLIFQEKDGISKYGPSQIGDFKGDILSEACGF